MTADAEVPGEDSAHLMFVVCWRDARDSSAGDQRAGTGCGQAGGLQCEVPRDSGADSLVKQLGLQGFDNFVSCIDLDAPACGLVVVARTAEAAVHLRPRDLRATLAISGMSRASHEEPNVSPLLIGRTKPT